MQRVPQSWAQLSFSLHILAHPGLAEPEHQSNLFFSSFSPSFPLRPADEPSREPNPSAELTCTSLAPKGGRDSGANGPMAKPSGQDPPSTVTSFLYGVSLPTQMAVDLKQEVSGPKAAGEVLLPRPAGELKVPSSQEYSDCCGNSLEFALRRGPGQSPPPPALTGDRPGCSGGPWMKIGAKLGLYGEEWIPHHFVLPRPFPSISALTHQVLHPEARGAAGGQWGLGLARTMLGCHRSGDTEES